MKVFLYSHSGSENHGCEAIVRSTSKILNLNKNNCTLYSYNYNEDNKYNLNKIINVEPLKKDLNKISIKKIIASFLVRVVKSEKFAFKISFEHIINSNKKTSLGISIGGDVYCYKDSESLSYINKQFRKNNIKTILWGCSIDKEYITCSVKEDLKNYDIIVTRESLTYNVLKSIGKKVLLASDPAFQLEKIDLPLPENFIKAHTVGINISPLIISCEKNKGITKENYIQLIKYIINDTNMNVALIPHVIWKNNDDRKPLKELYDLFKNTNRICLLEDCNCMELKGYISRCKYFIGARTHATIAAYSTCIPTLVVGYSVKAKGIAKDIFGTYDNYVISVQSLREKDDLVNAFKWLIKNEENIRNHLNNFIPSYIEHGNHIFDEIRNLIE